MSAETCTIDIFLLLLGIICHIVTANVAKSTPGVVLVQCGGTAIREAARHWEGNE